jgi:hypothetical protein
MGELAQLEADVARLTQERDELRARRRLPMLDNLRIASPCTENWESMPGDARVRHCGSCSQNVYNLSEMTRDEAEALLRETAGNLCARYYRRHDGTVMTADCAGTPRLRPRPWGPLAAVAALLSLVLGWLHFRKPAGYSFGSVGFADRPATMTDVIYERFYSPDDDADAIREGSLGMASEPGKMGAYELTEHEGQWRMKRADDPQVFRVKR